MTIAIARVFLLVLLLIAPSLMAQSLAGRGLEPRRLVVSLPHGGCSLMIHADGSGVIHYGAAPQAVRVPARSFEFDQVVETLAPALLPWGARASLEAEAAGVVMPGSNHVQSSTDTDTIRRLLDQAWQARLPPDPLRFKHEQQEQAWVKGACGF